MNSLLNGTFSVASCRLSVSLTSVFLPVSWRVIEVVNWKDPICYLLGMGVRYIQENEFGSKYFLSDRQRLTAL